MPPGPNGGVSDGEATGCRLLVVVPPLLTGAPPPGAAPMGTVIGTLSAGLPSSHPSIWSNRALTSCAGRGGEPRGAVRSSEEGV